MRLDKIEIVNLPTNRSEARKKGSSFYFTGKSCKRGHSAPRYASTGQCIICQEENYRQSTKYRSRPSKQTFLAAAHKIALSRGGKCLSNEYLSAKNSLLLKCSNPNHQPFKITYDNLRHGRWCPKCKFDKQRGKFKYNIEDMHRAAAKRGGKCFSTKFEGVKHKIKWSCGRENHPPFLSTPDNVLNTNKWCPLCGEEKKGRDYRPVEDVINRVKERGGEIVSFQDDYKGYHTRVVVKCSDGHTWPVTVHSLLKGSWCPKCIESVGETITRKIFEATFKASFPKTRPNFLKSKRGGRLELDGFNAEIGIAFEYQGPYHSRHDQIRRDNEKRELCKNQGIKVVEIEYVENPYPPDNLFGEVERAIHGIAPSVEVILPESDLSLQKLNALREIASSRGGKLLSEVYLGAKNKLLWSCRNPEHPPWKATPQSIIGGHWCPRCGWATPKKVSKIVFEGIKDLGKAVGLTLKSKDYRGSRAVYVWQCQEGHIIERTKIGILKSVNRGRNPCTVCAGTSKKQKGQSKVQIQLGFLDH